MDVIRGSWFFTFKNPMNVISLKDHDKPPLAWTLSYNRHIIACTVLATFPNVPNLKVNNRVNTSGHQLGNPKLPRSTLNS